MKNQKGIWLDQRQAFLIALNKEGAEVSTIPSQIEDFHPVGGARSKTPWGPMDVVSEKKTLERQKHQMQNYFDEIMKAVKDADEVYLFGPAATKNKLEAAIENNNSIDVKVLQTDAADKMTEPQMIAKVKAIFKWKPLDQ